MPRSDTIPNILPPSVLAELHAEFVKRRFTDFKGISVWLEERGYRVSKSTLHRYAVTYRAECIGQAEGMASMDIMTIRMQCITAASRVATEDSVIETAEKLLRWVVRP